MNKFESILRERDSVNFCFDDKLSFIFVNQRVLDLEREIARLHDEIRRWMDDNTRL